MYPVISFNTHYLNYYGIFNDNSGPCDIQISVLRIVGIVLYVLLIRARQMLSMRILFTIMRHRVKHYVKILHCFLQKAPYRLSYTYRQDNSILR